MFTPRKPDKARYLNAMSLVAQEQVPFVETESDFKVVEQVLGRKLPGVYKSYELTPTDYVEYLERLGMDMAYATVPWKLGRKEKQDADGRFHYVNGTIKTRADLKRIKDPGDDQIRARLDELLAALDGSGIGIIYNHWNTPVTVTTAVGYEHYYLALAEDADFLRGVLQARRRDHPPAAGVDPELSDRCAPGHRYIGDELWTAHVR